MKKALVYVYLLVAALAVAHSVYFYPAMPEKMAVHFSGSGAADGWSSKEGFFAAAAVMFFANLFIFVAFPWLLKRFRIRKLNVPQRSFWLSDKNIGSFYSFFSSRMAVFGIANILFGVLVLQLVFVANAAPVPKLDNGLFLGLLSAYFVFVIIWLFTFFKNLQSTDRSR